MTRKETEMKDWPVDENGNPNPHGYFAAVPVDETGNPNPHGHSAVMGDVVQGAFITKLELPPDKVLQGPIDLLSEVVVLGWVKGEAKFYFGASDPDMSRALMLLEMARQEIIERTRA